MRGKGGEDRGGGGATREDVGEVVKGGENGSGEGGENFMGIGYELRKVCKLSKICILI